MKIEKVTKYYIIFQLPHRNKITKFQSVLHAHLSAGFLFKGGLLSPQRKCKKMLTFGQTLFHVAFPKVHMNRNKQKIHFQLKLSINAF